MKIIIIILTFIYNNWIFSTACAVTTFPREEILLYFVPALRFNTLNDIYKRPYKK